jgi:lipopolysaccharide exporter
MHGSITRSKFARKLRLSGSQALAASTVLTNAVRLLSTMCLTRLLSPDVYGISGLIVSIFLVLTLLSDAGFQAFIVRHQQSDDPEFLSAVWTIHAARGAALSIVAVIVAWPLSLLLHQPSLTAPLAVASFTFAIDGQASLHQYRALRQGEVQRFALLNLAIGVSQTIAAIILAFFIRNIWAIVGSMLIASMVRVWLSYGLFGGERHSLKADRHVASEVWRFSRMIAVSSALTLIITQIDKLAMSRILPLSQFGAYVIASTLAAAPMVFAYNYASAIVYPTAAAAWRDGRSLIDTYYQSWGRFFYAYALGGGVLIGGADLLIRLLYDPRYLAAATYLTILAIGTTMTMVTRSMQELLVASGRIRMTLELNVVRLVWLVLGGVLALIRMSPMMFVLTIGLIEVPAYLYACWRMKRFHLISWWRETTLWLTVAAGLALGFGVSLLGRAVFPNL